MRRTFAIPLAALFLTSALTGCGLFSEQRTGPTQVNDLVGAIERVYVDSEVSKDRVQAALESLQAIVSTDFKGDVVTAYAEFVAAIDASEQQAEKLRDSVNSMKSAADPVFDQWSDKLKTITSVTMRRRSRNRLMTTRERYDTIVVAVEPAQAAYDAVNKNLRDHATFLGHDLNAASLVDIQADVRTLATVTAALQKNFDASLEAARAYVDAAAPPERVRSPEDVEVANEDMAKEEEDMPRVRKVSGTER